MNIAGETTLFIKVAAVTVPASLKKSMIYINVYQIKFISNKGIKSQQKNLPVSRFFFPVLFS